MVGIERDPAKEAERHARISAHKEAILQKQHKRSDDSNADKTAQLMKEAEERAAAFRALQEAEQQTAIQEAKQRQVALAEAKASTHIESPGQKLMRKFKENPFVPLGMLATTAALTYGLINFRQGNQKMSQMMMRARVGAQGLTIVAVIGGLFVSGQRTVFGKDT